MSRLKTKRIYKVISEIENPEGPYKWRCKEANGKTIVVFGTTVSTGWDNQSKHQSQSRQANGQLCGGKVFCVAVKLLHQMVGNQKAHCKPAGLTMMSSVSHPTSSLFNILISKRASKDDLRYIIWTCLKTWFNWTRLPFTFLQFLVHLVHILPRLIKSKTSAMPAKHITRFASFSSLALLKCRVKTPIGIAQTDHTCAGKPGCISHKADIQQVKSPKLEESNLFWGFS